MGPCSVTAQAPHWCWHSQARTKATMIFYLYLRLRKPFSIPEKNLRSPPSSKTFSHRSWRCWCHSWGALPSFICSHTAFQNTLCPGFPSALPTGPSHFASKLCPLHSGGLQPSVLCPLFFSNCTPPLGGLIQFHVLKYHLYASSPHIYFSIPNPGWCISLYN